MNPAKAAVLVGYLEQDNELQLLFIERSQYEGDPHSGQVAFPGGRFEDEDQHLEGTALREAREEIGLKFDNVDVISPLPSIVTGTGFVISPFLARILHKFEPVMAPVEVASVFWVPVSWLAGAEYESRTISRNGQSYDVLYFEPFQDKILWGASARIAVDALAELRARGIYTR